MFIRRRVCCPKAELRVEATSDEANGPVDALLKASKGDTHQSVARMAL